MIRDLFEQKPELKKIILFVLLIIVMIIIGVVIFSVFKGEDLTYEQLEDKMRQAAINYYESNNDKLPTDGNSTTISYNSLVEAGNLKAIDKYLNNGSSCTGSVLVKNANNNYSYTPYLDCGGNYKTLEFYNKLLTDNPVVTEKSGLYVQGDSKIFRGEKINNFVSMGNSLWRIVRVDSDNTIKLILYSGRYRSNYDNRYNSERGTSVGKNDYNVSRLKETLDSLYNSESFISSNIKGKLVSKPLCLGGRNETDNINDGSIECSQTINGEYIGNLSLYEYINASLDSKCQTVNTNECQNYNYLVDTEYDVSWWLSTPSKDNTYQVYFITSSGYIDVGNCSINLYARPTIYLGTEVVYSSGTGTLDDPYVIR